MKSEQSILSELSNIPKLDKYSNELTKEELEALRTYTDGIYYTKINSTLRSSDKSELDEELARTIVLISSAINKYTGSISSILYRGTISYEIDPKATNEELLANAHKYIGKVITSPSFRSTSTNAEVAESFVAITNPILLRLTPSSSVLRGAPVTQYRSGGFSASGESEVLIDVNSNILITGITRGYDKISSDYIVVHGYIYHY